MTDITISEAVSEFRKFSRAFKAMEHAETVLEALSKIDVLEREATERLKAADNAKEKAEKDLGILTSKISLATLNASELEEKAKQLYKSSQQDADQLITNAKIKAGKIVAEADVVATRIQKEIVVLKNDKDATIKEVRAATSELQELKDKIAKERKRILDSFGG